MRRGMYCGTLPIPVTRSSVVAVWRVFVSDHSGWPVTSQSLPTQINGAAAASRVRRTISRRVRNFESATSRVLSERSLTELYAHLGVKPSRYNQ